MVVVDGDKVWMRMIFTGANKGGFLGPPNWKSFKATVMEK